MEKIVVGAGHAGFQLAASLRVANFRGDISLLNGEAGLPYQRPPLSKDFLKSGRHDALHFRGPEFFSDNEINLVAEEAVQIDRVQRKVVTASRNELSFDHLVIATGTVNRLLEVPGAGPDIIYIKTLGDAEGLRRRMPGFRKVVVVGGGFIGLEFAAAAAPEGIEVNVVDAADRLMSRTASRMVSAWFEEQHRRSGVRFYLNATVTAIARRNGAIEGVTLNDGRQIEADAVVVGIGSVPCQSLASEAGLTVNNGIVVDQYLRTSDPSISAIGDCSVFPSLYAASHIRLECVQNAADQAKCVALRITGSATPYTSLPWFWSEQGDDRLQIAGLIDRHDTAVVRGAPEDRSFSVFCCQADRLVGVESVNRAADHIVARRLLTAGSSVDPAKIADASLDLKSLLDRHLPPS